MWGEGILLVCQELACGSSLQPICVLQELPCRPWDCDHRQDHLVFGYHHGFSLELAGKRCVQPTEKEAAGKHSCLEDGEEEENVHSLCCRWEAWGCGRQVELQLQSEILASDGLFLTWEKRQDCYLECCILRLDEGNVNLKIGDVPCPYSYVKNWQQEHKFPLEHGMIFSWLERAGVCRIAPFTNARCFWFGFFFNHLHQNCH